MPKKISQTPIEKAISESSDRRVRWAARQRRQGFVRVSVSVPEEYADTVRVFANEMRKLRERDFPSDD